MSPRKPRNLPLKYGGYSEIQIERHQVAVANPLPWVGDQEVIDLGPGNHTLTIDVPLTYGAEARAWSALIARLRGPVGTYWIPAPPKQVQTRNAGAVVLDGAGQGGITIRLRGMVKDSFAALEESVFIEIAGRLHEVLDDVVSDSEGAGEVSLFPAVSTRDLPDGQAVEWREPKGEFALPAQSPPTKWNAAGQLKPFSLAGLGVSQRVFGEVDLDA